MTFRRVLAVLLILAALACIVVGVIYLTQPSHALPAFLPGHKAKGNHHHKKSGLVAIGVGVLALIGAAFAGRRSRR